jgi:hypothetical protein
MSQTLHIFRKDVRHHWPEILLSLALLICFAIEQPRAWTHQTFDSRFLTGLVNYLPAFMILSWGFLILRLVQGESLIGDRLFWITRPYEWHKLLAAKLLSIALFIHLPLFVCQLLLLKLASFPVRSSVPGLLYVHLLFAMAIVLPFFTLGSITSGLGQASLALLVIFLLLIGFAGLITVVIPEADLSGETDTLDGLLYVGACLTAIFVQFIYRKALLARLVVTAFVLLVLLILVLTPYAKLINRDFPVATSSHPLPLRLSLDRSLSFSHQEGRRTNSFGDEVTLEIPFQIVDLGEKTIAQIRAVKLELEFPDGKHWTSHWTRLYESVSYGRTRIWPSISMKKAVFERFKNDPVRAHVSFGFNVYQTGSSTQIFVRDDRLSIPGGARCMSQITGNGLRCFAALREPEPLFILAQLPNSECQISQEFIAEGLAPSPASYSSLSTDTTPSLEFSPIQEFTINLARQYIFEDRQVNLPVCSGTSLFLSTPKFLYSVRDEIDLGNITLMNYLPTFPRGIIPPHERLEPGTPSNSLSWDLPPRSPSAGPQLSPHHGPA